MLLKWKVILFAFLLVAAITAISIATGFTPTGGGDPLPGGGIPI